MGILLKEHSACTLILSQDHSYFAKDGKLNYLYYDPLNRIIPRKFKIERGKDYYCYNYEISENKITLRSDYFVGIDWLTKDRFICVEPKLNMAVSNNFDKLSSISDDISQEEIIKLDEKVALEISNSSYTNDADIKLVQEVNVVKMLLKIMSHKDIANESHNLLLVDWEAPKIEINQKQDLLSPFLIVKFLKLLQGIAKKGLKKSYYKVQENLPSRIKGKIIVSQQIKQNVLKNKLTSTVCEYQEYGENSIENRFLKKVYMFCSQYVENNKYYFLNSNISWIINYIQPIFQTISSSVNVEGIKHLKYNPFYSDYKETIMIGQLILKRFSYNITNTTAQRIATPPFWIDMPKLFELYVYAFFIENNPKLSAENFNYQFSTNGNSLDFLISHSKTKIVVDTKYKLKYNYSQIHEDIRQVAGYARLKKVRNTLGLSDSNEEIPCLIIYPFPSNVTDNTITLNIDDLLSKASKVDAYNNVYKLGIHLPIL